MSENMIAARIAEHQRVAQRVADQLVDTIAECALMLDATLARGGKILVMGNGGSAADAQHFVAELVGRFQRQRSAFAAVCLNTDTATLTAVANDYAYDEIFARQIEALARPEDLVFCISTSGASGNILKALQKALEVGCSRVALLGHDGGEALTWVDHAVVVPCAQTPRIQEMHIMILHILAELIEEERFDGDGGNP